METPPRKVTQGLPSQSQRKYTEDEKKQLLINLELEVQDRIRQFEAYLAHSLEAFRLRHENEVTRIPRAVRALTMGEFADKYDGDVNNALQAIAKARLEASDDSLGDVVRKKVFARAFLFTPRIMLIPPPDRSGVFLGKWEATHETTEPAEPARSTKNARLTSPLKKDGARAKLNKTPMSRARQPPPSPGMQTGFKSPYKAFSSNANDIRHSPAPHQRHRVPSASHFNPTLPKTPAYPPLPSSARNDGEVVIKKGENKQLQQSNTILRGSSLAQSGTRQGGARTLEMILSLKVYTKSGDILELDPLSTTVEDLDLIEGVTEDARKRAKDELVELTGLMEKLGKWRI
ncbi:hypothetical protein Clacol_007549 [Clathrus columnatus]|uniref:Borealin N-terminal domain-containing protein n=1 Tax=Clathrus columnatus TaxID=1419009 RepID=A0AAV5AHS7_9AGAM|nr:hypothetical protein Clacol_007549 [Clathrus columnatus]